LGNCFEVLKIFLITSILIAYFRLKMAHYQVFVPSLIPTRVGVCAPFFQNIFFAQNTKTAEKPDKQGVFSGKNFFEIFLI
jgi:hypothetical protein